MDPVLPTATPAVTDGFGQRTIGLDSDTGEQVELLEFAPQVVEHSGFVTALAERVAKFASVRHASYVHMRRLDRPAADRLQLVSDLTPGWRLSEMLEESTAANTPIDSTIVIALLRQLLPAVALFSRHNRDASIGVLSPHRLIVTPQARLAIAEYAFGPAVEKLNLGREKLWRDYRISMPPSTGLPRANPRADVTAIGVVGLSLLLGRSLELDEFPNQLEALLEGARESRNGQPTPLSGSFKNWLKRALQIDPDKAFQSPSESQLAFESVLASDRTYVTTSPALANWVAEIGGALDARRRAAAPPEPEPQAEPPAEPQPAAAAPPQEIEVNLDDLLEQSASALAQESRQREHAEAQPEASEEVEVPLDEPQPEEVTEAPVAAAEPAPAMAEEDPIAAQLRTYQPKMAPKAEPPPPPVEEEDPIAAQLRTYQPRIEEPKEEEDPIAAQLRTYQPKFDAPPPERPPEPEPELEPVPEPEPVQEEAAEEPVAEEPAPEPVAQEEDVAQEEAAEPEPVASQEPAWAPPPKEPPPPPPRMYEPPPPPPRVYEPPLVPPPPRVYEPPPPAAAETYEEPVEEAQQPAAYEPEEEAPAPPPPPAYAPPPPPPAAAAPVEVRARGGLNPVVLGLGAVVLVLLGAMGWLLTRDSGGGGLNENVGELVVQSRPEGAQVKIDGEVKGVTPLTVRLDRGAHVLEVQSGTSEPRVIPLMIQGGIQTSQYVELTGTAATGGLELVSDPPGARIIIDGQNRGTTPMTIRDLTPGDHTVVLELRGRKNSQTVKIQAGTTAKLSVPMR